jgi:glycine cleavage system H protein
LNPEDRKYTEEHEWVKLEDPDTQRAVVGITHYAQDQLGDIVFFELPQPGSTVAQLGKIGEVESVKSVSDLFSPVSGEVLEINTNLLDHPELANEDPFGKGWLVRLAMTDVTELENLMTADQYASYTSGLP